VRGYVVNRVGHGSLTVTHCLLWFTLRRLSTRTLVYVINVERLDELKGVYHSTTSTRQHGFFVFTAQ